jgi:steroid 5-alpha reductase family enzyme
MGFVELVGLAFLGIMMVQLVTFGYALRSSRVDSIDIAWGISFIAGIGMMQTFYPSFSPSVGIVDTLVVIWGMRLSYHIYNRFRRTSKQDERYSDLLRHWPKPYRTMQLFGRLFLVQALLATIISFPVIVVHHFQPPISPIFVVGAVVWVLGFMIESIADMQLKNFLKQHAGTSRVMTEGLWKFSRHPNYFGEIVMWWALAICALETSLWFLGAIGAMTITILICFISGVPLAEKRSVHKEGWSAYKRHTSAVVLWPPTK